MAGAGGEADWVRNLVADPVVEVRMGTRTAGAIRGTARVVNDPDEDRLARRLLAAKYQRWEEGRPLSAWATTALPVAIEFEG